MVRIVPLLIRLLIPFIIVGCSNTSNNDKKQKVHYNSQATIVVEPYPQGHKDVVVDSILALEIYALEKQVFHIVSFDDCSKSIKEIQGIFNKSAEINQRLKGLDTGQREHIYKLLMKYHTNLNFEDYALRLQRLYEKCPSFRDLHQHYTKMIYLN